MKVLCRTTGERTAAERRPYLKEGFVENADGGRAKDDGDDVPVPFHKARKDREAQYQRERVEYARLRSDDVPAEPDREVKNDAYDGGGHCGERRRQSAVAVELFDVRSAEKNPEEAWHEGCPRRHERAERGGG